MSVETANYEGRRKEGKKEEREERIKQARQAHSSFRLSINADYKQWPLIIKRKAKETALFKSRNETFLHIDTT